ncbi:response regulator [Candidatus Saccharibacteria bacterium]|nr:response regulator [Candidatus Saccharibacteria bacterium]
MRQSPRVIIAMANTRLAAAYSNRLSEYPYQVILCRDGQDLLQHSLNHQPELIIMDADLPTPGHDLIEIIQLTPETAHSKIILLTPLITADLRTRSKQLGLTDVFINSPGVIPEVLTHVHRHLKPQVSTKAN